MGAGVSDHDLLFSREGDSGGGSARDSTEAQRFLASDRRALPKPSPCAAARRARTACTSGGPESSDTHAAKRCTFDAGQRDSMRWDGMAVQTHDL